MKINNTKNPEEVQTVIDRHNGQVNPELEVEIQTDKLEGKLVSCIKCKRPLVVNRFFAPAKAQCKSTSCEDTRTPAEKKKAPAAAANVRLDQLIRTTRITHPQCRCDIKKGMSLEDLRALNAGCTAPKWVCQRLDSIRRQMRV